TRQLLLGDDGDGGRRLDDALAAARGRVDGDGLGVADVPVDRLVQARRLAGLDGDLRLLRVVAEREAHGVAARGQPGEQVVAVVVGDLGHRRFVDDDGDAGERPAGAGDAAGELA